MRLRHSLLVMQHFSATFPAHCCSYVHPHDAGPEEYAMNLRNTIHFAVIVAAAASLCGCGGSSPGAPVGCGNACPAVTYTASVSSATLSFSTFAGLASAAQSVTLTNTGTGTLTLASITLGGTDAAMFAQTNTCGATLAPGGACTLSAVYNPPGSGSSAATITFTDNATSATQTVALNGTALGSAPASATVDCSVGGSHCADTFTGGFTTAESGLATDPIAPGGFHGYADPSLRRDPNSNFTYLAYSWARSLADGTHVVDLHLAESSDDGATFTEAGPLYQSVQTTQSASSSYSAVDDSSTETIDLLQIALSGTTAGQTLWVQAHQSYLVAPMTGIYDQLNATNLISVSAVQLATPASAGAGAALLALATAPEARLGAASTDPSRHVTQALAALSADTAKCANWGQPALWYQSPNLYLALECSEASGGGNIDSKELAHFLYVTTPSAADATAWTWAYAGEFLTGSQAAALGSTAAETTPYQFFTEMEFVQNKAGQLFVLATPSVFSPPGSQQPVIQYGCRTIPVLALNTGGITLDTDATTGALVTTTKVTEEDLYGAPNEGPAACTFEPTAVNGIVVGRKYENLTSGTPEGFYIYPVNSTVAP